MSIIQKAKHLAWTYISSMYLLRDIRRFFLTIIQKKQRAPVYFSNNIFYQKYRRQFRVIKYSKSQFTQDLFVIYVLREKTHGFFVEFGATNGIYCSNTYLLETQFNWQGILAEPGRIWHEDLKRNRSCKIELKCVYNQSGEKVTFSESPVSELSTISDFENSDEHGEKRKNSKYYEVETITLNDLLKDHGAPKKIDYLSIDTEGSEFKILSNFDFNHYDISIITVEHNYTENREKIYNLLSLNGFKRVYTEYSQHDDWYMNKNLF